MQTLCMLLWSLWIKVWIHPVSSGRHYLLEIIHLYWCLKSFFVFCCMIAERRGLLKTSYLEVSCLKSFVLETLTCTSTWVKAKGEVVQCLFQIEHLGWVWACSIISKQYDQGKHKRLLVSENSRCCDTRLLDYTESYPQNDSVL